MGEYIKISENLYTNKKHHFVIKVCEFCCSNFFCRKDKISKKTCNSICRQKLVERNNEYNINSYVNDIIVGSLLSDGTIGYFKGMKNVFWSHSSTNENYIDYIISETSLNLHKFSTPESYFISSINGKRYKSKENFRLKSKNSISFMKYREDWYQNGSKIVPKDIKLSPTVVLHWYLGDGSISDETGITLCTDSFDIDSLDFLLYELSNLKFEPYLNYKRNRIVIPNRRVYEFLKYIGDCPVRGFEYKWTTIIKKSYLNRHCLNCGNSFDAIYNHQEFCNPSCSTKKLNKLG